MDRNRVMTSCYLCKNTKFKKRPGKVRDNSSLEIMECTSCGLVFLSSFSHISDRFYHDSGMHKTKIDVEQWVMETKNDDKRRFDYLKNLIKNKSLLDFGCGTGNFLMMAKDVASNVAGIEPEIALKSHFKKQGLKIFRDINRVSDSFDIITLFHVLEHIPDPRSILKNIVKKLKKGGQIIIEVPNSDDALLTLYKCKAFSKFTYWACHLFLFNESTLVKLTEQVGLKTSFITQVQRYPLSNHLYWLARGRPGGHTIWNYLDSLELNEAYKKQLSEKKACDTILGIFS